ncbi:type II secretion system F family protein [Aeromicrobium terrae]|nr:type II secretion system F family protein [Aeromicrobium terrae]
MNPMLVTGVLIVMGAVGALAYALLADPVPRIARSRRQATSAPTVPLYRVVFGSVVKVVDAGLRGRTWAPVRASELELADVRTPLNVVVAWLAIGAAGAFGLGTIAFRNPFMGLVLAVGAWIGFKLVLRTKVAKRRKAFASQLDPTLRIVASALRAGQSLPIAIASVAQDAEPPISDELKRISNEARVGRDLVEAMLESAQRMKSEDFRWFAEAVEVQRDTGGNLNDVIDTVAETIRDRAEIREKIRANASEGKASAWVLMLLPVGLGVLYSIMRPGYMDPLLQTGVGQLLLAASAVLYGVAYVWMRAIVNFKV